MSPTYTFSTWPNQCGTCSLIAETIPIIGARSQSVPSSVVPCGAGNAESPTSAIST